MKKLFLILSFLSLQAHALTEGILPSTEWQKNKLIHEISNKIERRLDPLIKDKKYLIDVSITTATPQKPDFSLGGSKDPKKNVRFSNAAPDKSNGDYIVFSKFGLEVPTIANTDKTQNDQKSEYEYLWKYNQSLNIFQNIDDINIKLSLTDKLPEEKRSEIQNIINKMDLGLGDIKPNYTFEFVNFDLIPESSLSESKQTTLIDMLSRFSNAIGLILASIVLGLIGLLLMKKFEQIKKDEKAKEGGQAAASAAQPEEKKDNKNEMNISSTPNEAADTSGIERFENYFAQNQEGAIFLVKKWINSRTEDEKKALYHLVKSLANDNLLQIFERISLKERETWKQTLSEVKVQEFDAKATDQFISTQVVEEMIVPNMTDDQDLQEMLINLNDSNAAQFIKAQPQLGAYLVELLSNKRVSSILNFMEPMLVKKLLKSASTLTKEAIQEKIQDLKMALEPFAKMEKENPLIQKICELIPLSSVQNDEALYDALREEKAMSTIKRMAKQYYPSFLIKELPQGTLQTLLSNYPNQKKAQLIYTLDEAIKEYFLSSLGEPGSTIREMIEIEMENFELDSASAAKVTSQKEVIWEEFVGHARRIINTTFEAQPEYLEVINQWIETGAEIINFPQNVEAFKKEA